MTTKRIAGLLTIGLLAACEPYTERSEPPESAENQAAVAKQPSSDTALPAESPFKLTFERESRDPRWAPDFEARISTIMKEKFPASRLETASCRATICKIVVTHDDAKAHAVWNGNFHVYLGSSLPKEEKPVRWSREIENSQSMDESTLYLTRNGYAEPAPDGTPRRRAPRPAQPAEPAQQLP